MYPFVHRRFPPLRGFYVEYFNEWFDRYTLEKNGEVDNRYGGGHEHRLQFHFGRIDK